MHHVPHRSVQHFPDDDTFDSWYFTPNYDIHTPTHFASFKNWLVHLQNADVRLKSTLCMLFVASSMLARLEKPLLELDWHTLLDTQKSTFRLCKSGGFARRRESTSAIKRRRIQSLNVYYKRLTVPFPRSRGARQHRLEVVCTLQSLCSRRP